MHQDKSAQKQLVICQQLINRDKPLLLEMCVAAEAGVSGCYKACRDISHVLQDVDP